MIQSPDASAWVKLTPDNTGSYVNGTWSRLANLPVGYGPLYFASAVLPDGRAVVMGGEYNLGNTDVMSNLGAIYDPVANIWTPLLAPPSWLNIGDAQCAVLPNGTFVIANPADGGMAQLNPSTLTFSLLSGNGKSDGYDEEGWTLMPDGTLLTIDTGNILHTERYQPLLDQWINAGNTPQSLVQNGELGPVVLRPDGSLFAAGASGHTAIYISNSNPSAPGTWFAGPDFPVIGSQLDIADGPSCLLPNGNVLCQASPGVYNPPSYFFEFDGATLTQTASPSNAAFDPSYVGNMLMLPTGQVLFTDESGICSIYTPTGSAQQAWLPTITICPSNVAPGQTYSISGTQFNGLSQCSAYGDDATNATNYPLVRIQNNATGHVTYCRTHGHSSMGVATGPTIVSTNFDVPSGIETGPSSLFVVANGIASAPQAISVGSTNVVLPTAYSLIRGVLTSGNLASLDFMDASYLQVLTGATLSTLEAPVQVLTTALSPTLTPTSLKLTVVSKVNTPGTSQTIWLWNYTTSSYIAVDTRTMTTSSQTVTVTAPGSASDFVSAGGTVQAKETYIQTGATLIYRWQVSLDLVNWTIQ